MAGLSWCTYTSEKHDAFIIFALILFVIFWLFCCRHLWSQQNISSFNFFLVFLYYFYLVAILPLLAFFFSAFASCAVYLLFAQHLIQATVKVCGWMGNRGFCKTPSNHPCGLVIVLMKQALTQTWCRLSRHGGVRWVHKWTLKGSHAGAHTVF